MAKKKVAKKKTPAKKVAKKKTPAKKVAKKKVAKKKVPAKKSAAAKKAPVKKKAAKKVVKTKALAKKVAKKSAPAKETAPAKKVGKVKKSSVGATAGVSNGNKPVIAAPVKLTAFAKAQKQRLLDLRDLLVDVMAGVAQDNLRGSDGGDTASAFGMHQADAGSDAYDRDFALNMLSQEQDALYEIDEALERVKLGTYGICEISGKKIMKERLEAIPFTRFTVECQAQLEREHGGKGLRRPVRPQLFDSESGVDSDGE
ncbi:MAG: RNA polymerase-binding transcription factor DksA [Verrucomicrobiales bacterium]|jgi:RNA polymerase-binding transcription factor DksA